jgi:hypothetical protein
LLLLAALAVTHPVGAMRVLNLLAQTQPIPDSLVGWLTGSAVTVLALGVLAFTRGWIVPGVTYGRVLEERDTAVQKLEERNREDRELLMPLLAENARAALRVVEQRSRGGR